MYIVKRSSHNPLIAPLTSRNWEARGTFNPCPIKAGGALHLFYRALGRPDALMTPAGISTIGKALSLDGRHFQNRRQFLIPEEEWERYGCEDPRVTAFEGTHVIFYTALGGVPFSAENIKVACALSKDLERVDERHLVTPFNAKAMTLFPERVNGKVTALLTVNTDRPPARIALAQCDELADLWNPAFWEKWYANLDARAIDPRRSEHDHVEIGAPPIKTKDGWLLVYAYIQNYFGGGERVFGVEAMLLDLKDPRRIVGKTRGPILVPEEVYERYGAVPDIVFPSGALLQKNGRLDIYYGGADTVCARASLNLADLLAAIAPERYPPLAARAKENPTLSPEPGHPWENQAVFNAAAADLGGAVRILYRAQGDDDISRIGYAESKNGVTITARAPEPVYAPHAPFEARGCEDPRITVIGRTLYMVYTAYDGIHPTRVALTTISVKDFLAKKWDAWSAPVLTTPENVGDKDTCVLPEQVDGQYLLLHRIDPMLCADLLPSLDFKKSRLTRCIEIMGPRSGMWDSQKIGIAGPPIKTKKGWVLIYHGVSKTGTYRLGAVLLDLKNPTVALSRSVDAILEPTESYERAGRVPKAVFSCGSVLRGDTLFLYYGGADTVLGVAKLSMKRLLKMLRPANLL